MGKMTFLRRRRGVAVLGMVLAVFVVLSIFALVAFNISLRTLNVEAWQTQHYEKTRLLYLARSGVNAVAEQLMQYQKGNVNASFDCFSSDPFNDKNTGSITINDSGFDVDMEITVSGDFEPYLSLIGKVTNSDSKSVIVSALYDTNAKKIVDWSEE